MKYFKFATSCLVTSLFSSLACAHLSYKGEVSPECNTCINWTGYYAGLNVGAVKHTMNITDTNAASFLATISQELNPRLSGGVQIGYRRQMEMARASAVYGMELSANFSNAEFTRQYGSPYSLYQLEAKNTLKNLVLLQLLGGIAVDRTLLFLAAGMSYIDITGTVTNVSGTPFFNSFSVNKKQFGTALGGGIEYAFTPCISARFKVDVISPSNYSTHDDVDNAYSVSNNIVQAAIAVNYKFA